MKLYSLKCPHCGGNLEVEPDLEMFFCKYCGAKLTTERISRSEMRIREMEHEEIMSAQKTKVELEKTKSDRLDDLLGNVSEILLIIVAGAMVIGGIILSILKK